MAVDPKRVEAAAREMARRLDLDPDWGDPPPWHAFRERAERVLAARDAHIKEQGE